MKKQLFLVSLVLILIVAISFTYKQALAAPKVLKLSSLYTVTSPNFGSAEWFAAELEKRTNGDYKIEFYKGGTLGKVADLPQLCADGVIDFYISSCAYNPNIFKLSRVAELMYITENPNANAMAVWDMYHNYPPLRDEWHKNGLIYAFNAPVGSMAVVSKDPINNLSDIKGLKVRTVSIIGKMVEKWGGIPVSLPFPEVYDSLNRGLIKGSFAVPFREVYVSRLWEVAPYVLDTGIGAYALVYVAMSKKTYDEFPPNIRTIVDQLREEANAYDRKYHVNFVKEVTNKLANEKSVKLISWSPEQKAAAKNLAVPFIWEDWIKEMEAAKLPGQECLNVYKKLIEKYEPLYPFSIEGYSSPYEYYKSLKK
jgi:TRAP-type transport system periplasmic protein